MVNSINSTSTLRRVQQELRSPLRVWRLLCSLSLSLYLSLSSWCDPDGWVLSVQACVCSPEEAGESGVCVWFRDVLATLSVCCYQHKLRSTRQPLEQPIRAGVLWRRRGQHIAHVTHFHIFFFSVFIYRNSACLFWYLMRTMYLLVR